MPQVCKVGWCWLLSLLFGYIGWSVALLANVPANQQMAVDSYYSQFLPRPDVSSMLANSSQQIKQRQNHYVEISYTYNYYKHSIQIDPQISFFISQLDLIRSQHLLVNVSSTSKSHSSNTVEEKVTIENGKIAQQAILEIASKLKRGESVAITETIWPFAVDVLQGKAADPHSKSGSVTNASSLVMCDHAGMYRGADGVCNNPYHPTWGSAGSDLIRITPSTYIDGLFTPRISRANGSALPSARAVSLGATTVDQGARSMRHTLSVAQWGLFVDHDLTLVPEQRPTPLTSVDCCASVDTIHLPECFPITVEADDPLYKGSTKCLNFVRSIFTRDPNIKGESAQQVNSWTHFLDGSQVYGSSDSQMAAVRAGDSAFLKTSGVGDMPRQNGTCAESRDEHFCFVAGDNRVNEHTALAAIHNIWLRMHNFIAEKLIELNPSTQQESVFQEARAVVIALLQHIVYSEWLPAVVGPSRASRFSLTSRASYAPDLQPAVVNEFAVAAMHFTHSTVPDLIRLSGNSSLPLGNSIFHLGTHVTRRPEFSDLVFSITQQPMRRMDNQFSAEMIGSLLPDNRQVGLDLVALSVQRGRDHGLATYTQMRNRMAGVCDDLTPVTDWKDLESTMTKDKIDQLKQLYGNVDAIDLYIGGISENRVDDGAVGPTLACLLADQFLRLKFGDRHFYNHLDSIFTTAQLRSIESVKWSDILCMMTAIDQVQKDAFSVVSESNPLQACYKHPLLNLAPWKHTLPRDDCNCLDSNDSS